MLAAFQAWFSGFPDSARSRLVGLVCVVSRRVAVPAFRGVSWMAFLNVTYLPCPVFRAEMGPECGFGEICFSVLTGELKRTAQGHPASMWLS